MSELEGTFHKKCELAKHRVEMKRALRNAGVNVPNDISTELLETLYTKVVGPTKSI